jgi:hypothetical protein
MLPLGVALISRGPHAHEQELASGVGFRALLQTVLDHGDIEPTLLQRASRLGTDSPGGESGSSPRASTGPPVQSRRRVTSR